MKGPLYEYNKLMMTQAEIAKLEGISRSTLADWYKKTGDMNLAVAGAKKSLAQRNIQYYDEILSLKAIAKKEKLKFESLKKNYETYDDIYQAVGETKNAQKKRSGDIFYYDKYMTIHAIAELEEVGNKALAKYYEETNDIYKAVDFAKTAQAKQNGTILYKKKLMTISGIAKLEEIKRDTLRKYYELYGNIDKAVFITKESQLKRRKALLRGKQGDYSEFSKYLGISVIKLDKLVSAGKTLEEIENEVHAKRKTTLLLEEESLYNYCLENSYNYWVIYYMINTYGKTPDEAIAAYVNNGQQVPIKWIYEKYHILLKHLMLLFGIDSNRLIKVIRDNHCSIGDAVTKIIFVSNNRDSGFSQIEIDWMQELYSFLSECDFEEKKETMDTFYVSYKELEFINRKQIQIDKVKRQLLLFEFSAIIDEWEIKELLEMFDLYNVTDEEIKLIFTELYKPFDGNIIDHTPKFLELKEVINSFILDSNFSISDLENSDMISDAEKLEIIRKREKMNSIFTARKGNFLKSSNEISKF